jgi:hypothetical protein
MKKTKQGAAPTPHTEVLWGAKAIADFIGKDERTTFYLLQKNMLPARKVGSAWTTTRSRLLRHFEGGEA